MPSAKFTFASSLRAVVQALRHRQASVGEERVEDETAPEIFLDITWHGVEAANASRLSCSGRARKNAKAFTIMRPAYGRAPPPGVAGASENEGVIDPLTQ